MMHYAATSERERRRNLSPEPSALADLRVCGRHALLFDDDASAAFINSVDALLPWSLHPSHLLDRYDVRHLLTDLPSRRKGGLASFPHLESGVSESDLERERYQDLPEGDEGGDDDVAEFRESSKTGAYGAVAFSYGNGLLDTSNDPGMSETVGYHPPFAVPESLLLSLPPSEKLHQIMSRTALFVSKHGGQSEIILRVKQGDNPTFGFLMPDHNLHPYFSFLVDHPELLLADTDSANPQEAVQKADAMEDSAVSVGALSLLGSVYGNEEEEDRSQKVVSDTQRLVLPDVATSVKVSLSDTPDVQENSAEITKKNEAARSVISDKFLPLEKKSDPVEVLASDLYAKKQVSEVPKTAIASTSNNQVLAPSVLADNLPILEPPNFLKSAVEKVIEFIVRNGKQFEAVLIEQDKPHGRFPFLLKSNPFHPYYLKVLQDVQESKTSSGKGSKTRKHDPEGHSGGSKKTKESCKSKDDDDSQTGASIGRGSTVAGQSIVASDLGKKEKFKMVIGGPKKNTSDQSSKPVQRHYGMSVDAAAEIVLAATRGLRNQKTNVFLSRGSSIIENGAQPAIDVMHQSKSIGSHSISSHGHDSHTKPNLAMSGSGNVSVAKAMAKNAALAAADEADSSEACLTKEQKQKAERLRRAKMFAAMLKSDSHQGTGSIPRLSPPLSNSGLSSGKLAPLGNFPQVSAQPSTSVAEPVDAMYRELDGSMVLVDGEPAATKLESQGKYSAEQSEERSTEKQHLGFKRHDKDFSDHKRSKNKHRRKESSRYDEQNDSEESGEVSNGTRSRYKSREKNRSRSRKLDHEDLDEHKHSRKRHPHRGSSEHVGEHHDDASHSSPKGRESESRHKRKHHKHSELRHRHRHDSRAESTSRPEEHRMRSHSERGLDDDHPAKSMTTVGNDGTGLSLNNLEASSNSHTATVVSDELRQKVRAMLLANM